MIKWSEEIRNNDNGYFCRHAIDMYQGSQFPVWIVSDCRRKTDVEFFKQTFNPEIIKHVRIEATEEVRKGRGWAFQASVDDAESECGLDHAHFDIVVKNNGDASEEQVLAP